MEYLIHILILISIFSILGLSLNLVLGYTGLLSVTQAAFYGVGAYVTAILLTTTEIGFLSAIIIAILVVVAISFSIGMVLNKFRGDYYALGSLGLGTILYAIFLNWSEVTNGALGINAIPSPVIFGIDISSSLAFLTLSLVILMLVYLISHYMINGAFGRVLKAIREDESVVNVFGYNARYFKVTVFTISAGMAATAGALFATYVGYIDPSTFTILEAVFLITIVILGGLANLKGSILGAIILIALPEALRLVGFPIEADAQIREFLYGVILIVLMFYRPKGLIGEYKI